MLTLIRRTFEILSPKYQRRVFILVVAAFFSAMIDALAFGLLYPFIQLLTNPSPKYHSTALRLAGDALGTHVRHDLEIRLGVAILALFILSSIVGIALAYAQSRVVAKSEADVSIRLFRGYLRAPYAEHLERNSSQLVRNVQNAVGDIHQLVLMSMLIIVGNLVQVVIIMSVMLVITPIVTVVAIVYFAVVSFAYATVISPRAQRAGREYLDGNGEVIRISQEGFGGIKSLQAHDALEPIEREFARTKWAFARNRYAMVYYSQLPQYFMQSALIGGVVLFGVVIYLTNGGDVTALIGLLMAASVKMLPALYTSLSSANRIRNGQASLETIRDDLRAQVEREAQREAAAPPPDQAAPLHLEHQVEFADVTFTYHSGEPPVVHHLDFTIPKGKSVALVGRSGAGKTTAVDLLLGLFPPTSGQITVDGQPLVESNLQQWRSRISYVPQEVFLLDGSVADNIRFSRMDGTARKDDELWSALERAQIAEFVRSLPDGVETVVGERGVRLSGGQRQRLGIARALYRNPEVLVLDEATSALDTATEAAVSSTIASLRGTLTMVIIAHRLSTVRDCDLLVLMEEGRIVAQGDFDTLRRENELFSELARLSRIEVG